MLVFDRRNTKYALFEGIEQEGCLKGQPTLFVVGCPSSVTIQKAYDQLTNKLLHNGNRHPANIYFGAGGLFRYSKIAVERFIHLYPKNRSSVTIENPIVDFKLMAKHPSIIIWMLPLIFKGLPTLNSRTLDQVAKMREQHIPGLGRIQLKFDYNEMVVVVPATDFVLSKYQDYGEDLTILHQKHEEVQRQSTGF